MASYSYESALQYIVYEIMASTLCIAPFLSNSEAFGIQPELFLVLKVYIENDANQILNGLLYAIY